MPSDSEQLFSMPISERTPECPPIADHLLETGELRPDRAILRRILLAISLAACAVTGGLVPLSGQTLPVGDSREAYLRLLEVGGIIPPGSFSVRPLPIAATVLSDSLQHPWQGKQPPEPRIDLGAGISFQPAAPRMRAFLRSREPGGSNEGGVWQGKGVTTAVDFGGTLVWRNLALTLHPTLAFSQNSDFKLAPVEFGEMTPFAYPWWRVDLPQKFGADPLVEVLPGQSSLRVTVGAGMAGIGTESLWWGPGIRNALLMSNNAPGIPHIFLGTSRPVDIWLGDLEARWIWGRLQRSDWFDTTSVDPGRYITGAVAVLSPRALPGLSLGGARVFYARVPPGGLSSSELLLVFQGIQKKTLADPENPGGNDQRDQLASLFARWSFPESRAEVWAEWGRNDHGSDFRDYLLDPGHASALTLGLRKIFPRNGNRFIVFEMESSQLHRTRTADLRATPIYYVHHSILEGYTQRGRVIGAGIGPGGSSQYAAVELYHSGGKIGGFLQRRVRDDDAYYNYALNAGEDFVRICCHNVFVDMEGHATAFMGEMEIESALTISWESNHHFEVMNDFWHLGVRLSGRWRPR